MCCVDSCNTKKYCKGYCQRHYMQIYTHGEVFVTRSDKRDAVRKGETALIPIGVGAKDGHAIVDKSNSWVSQYKWCLSSRGYVVTQIDTKQVSLHKLLIECDKPKMIDHINCDRLDNRMSNLRIVNASQNQWNKKTQSNNKTGYKGVFYINKSKKFCAAIGKNRVQTRLGYFETALEAATAYNEAAIKLHGKFARLNYVAN